MKNAPEARRALVWLAGILLVAALVRIWALDFCLPGAVCRPDEQMNAGIAISIAGGDPNPHFFSYPSLYFYALGLVDRLLVPAGELSALLLAGRGLSVVCGCLTVLATFLLGLRLGNLRTGLLAATLLAFNYLHVRDSHFMTVDIPVGLMVTVALLLVVRAMATGSVGAFALAGVAAGLATSTKYNAAVVGVCLIVAHWLATREQRPTSLRRLVLALGAMGAAFLIASPFVLLDLGTFTQQFGWELNHFRTGFYPGERESGTIVYYLTRILPHGFGLLPLLAAAAGAVTWIRRRDRRGYVLLAFLGGHALLVGGGTTVFARYLIPLVPVLSVAAAVGLERATALAPPRRRAAALSVALVLVLAQPAWNTVRFDRLLAAGDTRREATTWIRDRLAPGPVLQVGGFGVHHWVLDPRDLPTFRLLNQDPETQDRMLRQPLSRLAALGIRYVVTHEHPLLYSTLEPGLAGKLQAEAREHICFDPFTGAAADRAVYDYEDAFYIPFARFGGVERSGPKLCIYELRGIGPSGRGEHESSEPSGNLRAE